MVDEHNPNDRDMVPSSTGQIVSSQSKITRTDTGLSKTLEDMSNERDLAEKSLQVKRAMLYPKPGGASKILGSPGEAGVLEPIVETGNRLIFPYRPTIQYGTTANYETYQFTHTNYKYNAWNNTNPNQIIIDAVFTSQTPAEAKYTLAALHFFQVVTKGYFGQIAATNNIAGVPPPVLLFTYLGDFMFQDVPVVVTNFSTTLPGDIDYVEVYKTSNIPTSISMNITLEVQYNTANLRQTFDLDSFRTGKYLQNPKSRGFI